MTVQRNIHARLASWSRFLVRGSQQTSPSPSLAGPTTRPSTSPSCPSLNRVLNRTATGRTALLVRHFNSSPSQQTSLPPSSTFKEYRILNTQMPSPYSIRKIGQPNTLEYRVFVERDGVPVSWFHDIPLFANEQQTVLNMIVEIPRWTNAKLEVCSLLQAIEAQWDAT